VTIIDSRQPARGHRCRREIAAGAGVVLDVELLAEIFDSFCAITRAIRSAGPPGANADHPTGLLG